MSTYRSASGSSAEDLFIELFSDTFGAEKAGYLYSQYPFSDIYQNSRFADFLIENSGRKVAIEIDDEASHNPKLVSQNKFYDDLLKQNSMIYLGWDVYRWAVRQMQQQPETVKDELRVFLGQHPSFREIEDYLPTQRGKSLDGSKLELKEHQKQALAALEEMRCNFETIALLYHATGTGKTVTAVMDAKRFGKRTLFLAHTVELVDQATKTFRELWPRATVGRYVESMKQGNAFVVCGSIQSVALNLERFKPDDFGYIVVDEAHHASADTYAEQRRALLKKHGRVSEYDSENLAYAVIQNILQKAEFSFVDCVAHVALVNLVKDYSMLTEEETTYARNPLTHIDFLLFRRMDKSPLLAVEVDGAAFHAVGSVQANRDEKKNRIFEQCGIPLLRLRTDGSGEEERIEQALRSAVSNS